jgi:hypothetical protein
MHKKVWPGALAVFGTVVLLDAFVNLVLLTPEYETTRHLWRATQDINMALLIVCYAVQAFFFTFIFSKGYEGKSVAEGLRFGLYVSFLMVLPFAYMSYATMPIPFMLALKYFVFGTMTWTIAGAVVALVFGKQRHPPVPAM